MTQNPQAQKRYRDRRKAEQQELQATVATLRAQVKLDAQKRHALELEVLRLQNDLLVAQSDRQAAGPPPRPSVSPAQIDEMTVRVGHQLSKGLERLGPGFPPGSSGPPGPAVTVYMSQLTQMGLELVDLTLGVATPESQHILHDGRPPRIPAAADDPCMWRAVVAAVALSPTQVALVAGWRKTLLARLDTCFGARITLKLKATQTVSTGGGGTQWAEVLCYKAAEGAGYTLAAQAAAELAEVVPQLQRNVSEERAILVGAMGDLLLRVLTPVQAVRYLSASHPFSWNGLAFGALVARGY